MQNKILKMMNIVISKLKENKSMAVQSNKKFNDRLLKWLNYSGSFSCFGQYFYHILKGLGYVDIDLLKDLQLRNTPDVEKLMSLSKHISLCELWVFGAYEVIRSIDERTRENPEIFGSDINKKINEMKHELERIRVPLAKVKPSRRHNKDYTFPRQNYHTSYGTYWQINDTDIIFRNDLADKLLDLLEEIYNNKTTSVKKVINKPVQKLSSAEKNALLWPPKKL